MSLFLLIFKWFLEMFLMADEPFWIYSVDSLINSLIKKIRDNFRVYLEHAHRMFLTT